jgi:predicted amidohydrolase
MRVAVAQIEPKLGETEHNLELCLSRLEEAAGRGCSLVVLPECASSGYVFESAEEALPYAEEVPGPFVAALEAACARLGLHCVSGMLERDGDAVRNAAVLVGPDGLVGRYRKSHLPFLGIDRFVAPGDELDVFDTPIGRIGVEICYDLRFPEVTRMLALAGADLVALPTNWPMAARGNADILTRARAYENRVFLLVANRVGRERDTEFCGWSQICDVRGERIAEAGATEEVLLVAEIDLAEARSKEIVPVPGQYEMSLFGHRRPELYGALTEEHAALPERDRRPVGASTADVGPASPGNDSA